MFSWVDSVICHLLKILKLLIAFVWIVSSGMSYNTLQQH